MSAGSSYVVLDHARSSEQRQVMEAIQETGECPFCEAGLKKFHPNPILYQDEDWLVTANAYPYENTRHHLLLISRHHTERFMELSGEAGMGLFRLLKQLEVEYRINSGAVFLRFGDPERNGGSVRHLHVHLIVPDVEKVGWDELRVKLGSNK